MSKRSRPLFNLWIHDERFSRQELVISPEHFPGVREGDVLEIFHPSQESIAGMDRLGQYKMDPFAAYRPADPAKRLVLHVAKDSLDRDVVAKHDKLQISIAQHVAALFELQARTDVCVRKVNPSDYTAEYVELLFRDQYIGRSEMWRVKLSLNATAVYVGKKIVLSNGVRAQVKEISLSKGHVVPCAYITDDTKAIFRSESAKYFLFIQMAKGMWQFDEDGELYSEKCLHGFLPDLFNRWKEIGVNHVVSIVLFARVFYNTDMDFRAFTSGDDETPKANQKSIPVDILDGHILPINRDASGRPYRDYYRVVVDWEIHADWTHVLIPLKKEFVRFQKTVLQQGEGDNAVLSGVIPSASKGNILEAINLALNPFDKHYVDRDLVRTGLAIVVVTSGPGFYEVDKKMLRLTTQRMIENGIGMDLVCLSRPPLYTVPLFQFLSKDVISLGSKNSGFKHPEDDSHTGCFDTRRFGSTVGTMKSSNTDLDRRVDIADPLYYDDEESNPSSFKPVYNIPHWVDISFWNRPSNTGDVQHNFVLRAKMYELQMMGGTEVMGSPILVKSLDWNTLPVSEEIGDAFPETKRVVIDDHTSLYARYDDRIFAGEYDKPWRPRSMSISTTDSVPRTPISPELAPFRSAIHPPSIASGFSSYKATDTVRSLDADVVFKHQNNSSDELDTLTRNQGETLLARFRLSTGTMRSSKSSNQLSSLFSNSPSDEYSKRRRFDPKSSPRARASLVDHDDCGRYGPPPRIDSEELESDDERRYGGPSSSSDPINLASRRTDRQIKHSSSSSNRGSSPAQLGSTASTSRSPNRTLNLRQPIRQNYINPCNPSKNIVKVSSNVRRWQHVFARSMDPGRNDATPNWKGLCTPACLPLTTDYFPPQNELSDLYQDYNYIVSSDDEFWSHKAGTSEEERIEALLKELISQRLAQGFQLIAMPAVEAYQKLSLGTPYDSSNEIDNSSSKALRAPYLSLGDQLHLLRYDASGHNIEVKRYVRKLTYNTKPLPYACAIWPKSLDSYYAKALCFGYPQFSMYNWNYLDQYVAGYQDEMTESLRFWRTRFLLIPAETMPPPNNILSYPTEETLTEEEKRIEGFKRFEELCFARARRINSAEKDVGSKRVVPQPINIIRTDVNPSVYVRDEMLKAGPFEAGEGVPSGMVTPRSFTATVQRGTSFAEKSPPSSAISSSMDLKDPDTMKLTKSAPLNVIAAAMQAPNGVQFKDRRWHFKMYHRVFVGSDAVQWMFRAFADVDSHEDAVAFGNVLLEKGLFEHVKKSHTFLDGHYFYWLTKKYSLPATPKERHSPVGSGQVASIITKSAGGGWFGSAATSAASVASAPSATSTSIAKLEAPMTPNASQSTKDSKTPMTPNSTHAHKDTHGHLLHHSNSLGLATQTPAAPTSNLVTAGSLLEHLQKQQLQQPRKQTFELSKGLVIDLDPQTRSDRQEIAALHYDIIYCHNACYHFQLHWLLCTARLIEDMLVSWGRVADRCGLKLVEAPVEQAIPFSDENPFLSVVPIYLASQPPTSAAVLERLHSSKKDPYLYFEQELLKSEGFVLDMESVDRFPPSSINPSYNKTYRYTQYVHRTGVAFIQLREPGLGFYWVNNRLYLANNPAVPNPASRAPNSSTPISVHAQQSQLLVSNTGLLQTPTPTSAITNSMQLSFATQFVPATLRQRFVSVCSDAAYLEEFWKKLVPVSPASEAVDKVALKEALSQVPAEEMARSAGSSPEPSI
ncbi:hypothetical protein SeLEV6574_g05108 [Synchytrium endobioticum]|uniref:Vacuolar membrane-associated protein IML1 n=1 Tax=Synchytrium endobioticum TaxID=286115 RepID=A0A507CVX5_9FUNG|nr:hypothetical protein SeLEV6574_g05108 [Synchytrium endobioticum]